MKPFHKILESVRNWLAHLVHPVGSEDRELLIQEISASASPSFDFFLLVVLSCSIATLGLIINSPAVIIGAMLLAPLMSPIICIGLASINGDEKLIKSSAYALLIGAGLAIVLSFLMTLINRFLPFVTLQELSAEVIARTRPSPIDLLIALSGGLAAAYALTRPNLSATLPGVAIATALMPPLCTIGIGIALNRWDVAGGATLLFVTNAITIAFASALVFFIRGFAGNKRRINNRLPHSLVISMILVLVLLVPLSFISVKFFREAAQNRLISTVVANEINNLDDNAQLVDLEVIHQDSGLNMVITIRSSNSFAYEEVISLQQAIVAGLNMPVSLKVDQVIAEELDPLIPPTPTHTPTPGPSSTPTPTRTLNPTATSTATATPGVGIIKAPSYPSNALYQEPGGPSIGSLRVGQHLTILNEQQEYGGFVWVLVVENEGRVGWVPLLYLATTTVTPTP